MKNSIYFSKLIKESPLNIAAHDLYKRKLSQQSRIYSNGGYGQLFSALFKQILERFLNHCQLSGPGYLVACNRLQQYLKSHY